jgi:hypothetical protein
MCDYSMQHVASRPAKVGDVLITTRFAEGLTGGFSAVGEPHVAVCVLPGTELAFEQEIERYAALPLLRPRKLGAQVARFCPVPRGHPERAPRRTGAAGRQNRIADQFASRSARKDPAVTSQCARRCPRQRGSNVPGRGLR